MDHPARDTRRYRDPRGVQEFDGVAVTREMLDLSVASITLRDCTVDGLSLAGERLPLLFVHHSLFRGCDLSRITATGGAFGVGPLTSTYEDCDFSRADLRRMRPARSRFVRCRFDRARLDKWIANDAEWVACHFAGRLREVVFSGGSAGEGLPQAPVDRERNEVRGNDFRDADLDYVAFRDGVDLDAQLLPTAPPYARIDDAPRRLRATLAEVKTWPASPERDAALAALTPLTDPLDDRQQSVFGRVDQFPLAAIAENRGLSRLLFSPLEG